MKVMSYSMFSRFYGSIRHVLRAHHSIYPGWQFYLHHDRAATDAVYWKVLRELHRVNLIKLIPVEEKPQYTRAMLWRMMPIWSGEAEFVFCRDLDSLPTPRERRAVDQFIGLDDYIAHGINDNPAHSIPLMGGLCGFRCQRFLNQIGFESWEAWVDSRERNWSMHGTDQDALSGLLPCIQHRTLCSRIFDGAKLYDYVPCILGDIPYPLDIDPEVEKFGDSFINYCGAAGCNTPDDVICEFYDKHANEAVKMIQAVERELGWAAI